MGAQEGEGCSVQKCIKCRVRYALCDLSEGTSPPILL